MPSPIPHRSLARCRNDNDGHGSIDGTFAHVTRGDESDFRNVRGMNSDPAYYVNTRDFFVLLANTGPQLSLNCVFYESYDAWEVFIKKCIFNSRP